MALRPDIDHAIKALEQIRDGVIDAIFVERRADTGRVIVHRMPKRIVDAGKKPDRNPVDARV